jgi:hypothetical protein
VNIAIAWKNTNRNQESEEPVDVIHTSVKNYANFKIIHVDRMFCWELFVTFITKLNAYLLSSVKRNLLTKIGSFGEIS